MKARVLEMAKACTNETVHGGEKRRRSVVRKMAGKAWKERSAMRGSWAHSGITRLRSMRRRDQ